VPTQTQGPQRVRLTRRQLFGSTVFAGRNVNDVFSLEIDDLRVVASDALHLMGLQPA
jgi:hypothetical protein